MAGKAKRLNKVAKEYNISISTIVEFLNTKGIEIDSKPNTKIEVDILSVLDEEFAEDKEAKQNSESVGLGREKRESISLRDMKKSADKAEEVEEESSDSEPEEEKEAPAPVETGVVAESNSEEEVKEEPVVEESKEVEEEKPTVEEAKKPSVVGKIDLDAINQKTRPAKKKKEEKAEPKEEPVAEENKVEEKPAAEKVEEEKSEKPAAKEEVKTIKASPQKLSGPVVVGKIDLPVEKEKSDSASRKKRKRIKKVNIEQQANKNKGDKKGKQTKRKEKPQVTEAEIQKEIKETLARLQGGNKKKGATYRREKRQNVADKRAEELEQEELEKSILKITEFVTVSELANMMNVNSTEVIAACMGLGIFASINQRLDRETIELVASEFAFEVEFISADVQEAILEEEDSEEDLIPRPPIVTVMGHVDHGKTSLLDYIRRSKVTDGEAGGITQHIGAYHVETDKGSIAFLDTPGHAAFTAMRARGAQCTDVVILVVAADDGLMPQTEEAIDHARAAGVPLVVAVNKIDKEEADPDRVRNELSARKELVPEEWGGDTQFVNVSAHTGEGVDQLLESVLLQSEMLELKARPKGPAAGVVVEARLDKGRGVVATLLVQQGQLEVGDMLLAGQHIGRVRAMSDEAGGSPDLAGPSTPVEILGLAGVPDAGDEFLVVPDERKAREVAEHRGLKQRQAKLARVQKANLESLFSGEDGQVSNINIVLKTDVRGSLEALQAALLDLGNEEVAVNIVGSGVGGITESDANLALTTGAILVGFNVRADTTAKKLCQDEGLEIRYYGVIYDIIDDVKAALSGLLQPELREKILGVAEVRDVFRSSKFGVAAGCMVLEGSLLRNKRIRVLRDDIVVFEGELESLRRFKDDVGEVRNGMECGVAVRSYSDIRNGDKIEAYEVNEIARSL